jgi:hypothetical protein
MNGSKIVLPKNVAAAIAHYVNLADTKTEALTDILSMGYEAERSEIILRHFDGNHDELMQALICGYEVEKSPEDKIRAYWKEIMTGWEDRHGNKDWERYYEGSHDALITVLGILGHRIDGVND